jgi:hypothetical protein
MTFTAYALLAAMLVPAQGAVLTGKLGEKPMHDGRMIFGDFTPSTRADIPGYGKGDKVLTFRATAFKSAAAPKKIFEKK